MARAQNKRHKIKIDSLPEGFKLIDGKIVETKSHGGSTGDQRDYGLVKYGSDSLYGDIGYQDPGYQDVRYSLSSVPRHAANLEAEGGETVLTDLNNDGNFGLYDIRGPRHSKGGVPMFLPEQSYVFSDTPKMRMGKDELAEYGIESRKKKTPAAVSRKFGLNKYYGLLDDEYADGIQANSAEQMLKKNMLSLSKLAFGQEAKKNFSEGVPLASHPYLHSIGEDPIEFTARMEQITKQEALEKAMAALPPDQQQMMMFLQQAMEQEQLAAQAPQGMPQEGSPMPENMTNQMSDAAMQMQAPIMDAARYGLEKYQDEGEYAGGVTSPTGKLAAEGFNPTADWNVNKVLTYKDNPQYFRNRSWENFSDNEAYNKQIRERIESGGYGWNPMNQSLHKLSKSQSKPVSREDISKIYQPTKYKTVGRSSGSNAKKEEVDYKQYVADNFNKPFEALKTGFSFTPAGIITSSADLINKGVDYAKGKDVDPFETGLTVAGMIPFIPSGTGKLGKIINPVLQASHKPGHAAHNLHAFQGATGIHRYGGMPQAQPGMEVLQDFFSNMTDETRNEIIQNQKNYIFDEFDKDQKEELDRLKKENLKYPDFNKQDANIFARRKLGEKLTLDARRNPEKYFGERYTPEGTVENTFSGPLNKPDIDKLESWFPSMTGGKATRIRGLNPIGKGPFFHHISDEEREERDIEDITRAIRSGFDFTGSGWDRDKLDKAISESKWKDMGNEFWNRMDPIHLRRHGGMANPNDMQEGCPEGTFYSSITGKCETVANLKKIYHDAAYTERNTKSGIKEYKPKFNITYSDQTNKALKEYMQASESEGDFMTGFGENVYHIGNRLTSIGKHMFPNIGFQNGGTPRYQGILQSETPPESNFAAIDQTMLDNPYDDDQGMGTGIDPSTGLMKTMLTETAKDKMKPRSFAEMESDLRVDADYIPTISDPTVTRDKGSISDRIKRGKTKFDTMMDSPGMKKFGDTSVAAIETMKFLNESSDAAKALQAEQDLTGLLGADNMRVDETQDQGDTALNTGLPSSVIQGRGPSGYNLYRSGKDGGELTEYQDKGEVKSKQQENALESWQKTMAMEWPDGKDLTFSELEENLGRLVESGITKEEYLEKLKSDGYSKKEIDVVSKYPGWRENTMEEKNTAAIQNKKDDKKNFETLYMSDSDKSTRYREMRYDAYKARRKSQGLKALPEKEYHKNYVKYQKQVRWIQNNMDEDARMHENWDSKYDWTVKDNKTKGDASKPWGDPSNPCSGRIDKGKDVCYTKGGKTYKNFNWYYDKVMKDNNMVPMDKDMISHMQSAYIGGVSLHEQLRNQDIQDLSTYDPKGSFTDKAGLWKGNVSKEDGNFGNTTGSQGDNVSFLEENVEEVIIPDVAETTMPIRELDVPDIQDEYNRVPRKLWSQDVMKLRALADRERKGFFPYQPPTKQVSVDSVEEDITPYIGAAGMMYNTLMQNLNPGSQGAQDARSSVQQAKMADFIANSIGQVNARNAAGRRRQEAINAQYESQANLLEDTRKVKRYDDTMEVLDKLMNEENFDREEYVDAFANMLTNAAYTENLNKTRDFYNIDPEDWGAMKMINTRALDPVTQKDDYAAIDNAAKMAERYTLRTKQQPTKEMMNAWMNMGQPSQSPNESYLQREVRNNPHGLRYKGNLYETQGQNWKMGKEMKRWAVPFYTGKMGY